MTVYPKMLPPLRLTRSLAQKSALKDLVHNGQSTGHRAQGCLCDGFQTYLVPLYLTILNNKSESANIIPNQRQKCDCI
ncbi:hypothetical protein FBD73_11305 [Lacticaseibacillus paracasei]|nr:hypothetical protein F0640_02450 [Lacticaseibacillus paracasei]PTS70834.1 hypothetical protein DBQ65_04020 [Lactobacillus sp. DS3_6]KAB1966282.1 hypothetical protein F8272_06025 [Lacticaseibacillus paracasei]MBB1166449.1 hypothetical protein [Lacticaseibacillus paracasei]MCS6150120.1 hypothetical protein [Lacticaseibacillus paracasei]